MIHVVEVSVSVGMVTWRLAGICVLLDCYVDWRKVLNLFACQCHRSRSVWRVQRSVSHWGYKLFCSRIPSPVAPSYYC